MEVRKSIRWKGLGLWVATLLVLAGLAGCNAAPASEVAPPLPQATAGSPAQVEETGEISGPTAEEPSNQDTEAVEAISPTAVVSSPDPVTETPAPQPVREGLQATDPASVQLASGEVQLVEFFAFW